MARLHDIPAIIREFSDKQAAELSLIENIQRQDLTAIEEARGYRALIDAHGYSKKIWQALWANLVPILQ